MVFADLGLSSLYFSLELAAQLCNVLLYLPSQYHYSLARTTLFLNRHQNLEQRLVLVNSLPSSEAGVVKMKQQNHEATSRIELVTNRVEENTFRIPTVRLDKSVDWLDARRKIVLLYLSLDGHELETLLGCFYLFKSGRILNVIHQLSPLNLQQNQDLIQLFTYMEHHGFILIDVDSGEQITVSAYEMLVERIKQNNLSVTLHWKKKHSSYWHK